MNSKRYFAGVLLVYALILPTVTLAQTAVYNAPKETLDKIKDEGMNRSHVMDTLSYLSDVIGPRLTASPGMKRANEWTRDTMAKWGMANAHLEPWGPFGRGWTLKKFFANVDGPVAFPFIAYPKAWSPGTDTLMSPPPKVAPSKNSRPASPPANIPDYGSPFTREVVWVNANTEAELAQYKGKLLGKIVLVGPVRELKPHFTPDAVRSTEKELLDLADARDPNAPRQNAAQNAPPANNNFAQALQFSSARLRFLYEQGAAVIIDAGARNDDGTVFVSQASAVQPAPVQGQPAPATVRAWDKGAIVPIQLSAGVEHFNRLVRLINAGEHPTMTVDLKVEYQDADPNGYNTIAEIPGSDKADEIVMLGGHLDSWHAGTGATDNAAGCAVMMEAMRIIKTLGLQPRRTIRMALWTGEEQGLLGSREYVKDHFGWRGDTRPPMYVSPGGATGSQPMPLVKGKEYDKFSSYFNIDNGTGRIRGVYLQGNWGVAPIFRQWLETFRDPHWYSKDTELGASTLSMSNTGGTDHLSFDSIGLPGFQFIQDEMDYTTRTHHSNMDVFDRIQADDVKQIATIVAAFVYQAAMTDEPMPKKPLR